MASGRAIILDTETTGLDPLHGHRIIEIGAIEMVDGYLTDRVFHQYIHPERDIPEEAVKVHGITATFLQDKPLFKAISGEFKEFISGATLVIHNAAFDMKFINHELQRVGLSAFTGSVIDTLQMARRKFPGAKNNLDALCRRFNIDNSNRTYHGALLDAELLYKVYIKLTGADQGGLAIMGAQEVNTVRASRITRTTRHARQFGLTDEERAAHKAFMKSIKEPLW